MLRKYFKTTKTVHRDEPDYSRPLHEIPQDKITRIQQLLAGIYGVKIASDFMPELERILKVYYAHKPSSLIEMEKEIVPDERFTEKDIILITYGDLIREKGHCPLETLAKFCESYLDGHINTLHILPFFPYSSDRGFSVIDFETVDPNLGSWEDIGALEAQYQLMFDGVINHVSSKSRWFQEFLNDNAYYSDFFISYDSRDDLSPDDCNLIFRPRTSEILTEFQTVNGPKFVWTTFSKDQIDLNYKNPNVLMRVLDILLLYIRRGADIIRLDAVTYLWAEAGTSCIHQDETHGIIKLFRGILDAVAPGVALITETNVPHEDNISYFGNGHDEAQMVYNFALPPLVLHTFYTEDATTLSEWAMGLKLPSDTVCFFNFLDSHDGIGVMAVKNTLTQDELSSLVVKAKEHGGYISYKTGADGADVPYEINITWFSALNKEESKENIAFQVKRFIASRIIALVLKGVPGIYMHSLIGTKNDIESVLSSHSKRDINRKVIDLTAINKAIKDPTSRVSRINRELGRLIGIRIKQKAFHPNGDQRILLLSPEIFSVIRSSPDKKQHLLCLTNIAARLCRLDISLSELGIMSPAWYDLVNEKKWMAEKDILHVMLQPYDVIWLEPITSDL